MNTESVIHAEDQPSQPIVKWFPPAAGSRAAPVVAAGAGAVVFGALVYAGFALARSAMHGRTLGPLRIDRLVVRRLEVLDD